MNEKQKRSLFLCFLLFVAFAWGLLSALTHGNMVDTKTYAVLLGVLLAGAYVAHKLLGPTQR